jgi:hypothetical protein
MVEYCRVESAVLIYTEGTFSVFSDDNFHSYRLRRRKWCTEQSVTCFVDFAYTRNVLLLSTKLDRCKTSFKVEWSSRCIGCHMKVT